LGFYDKIKNMEDKEKKQTTAKQKKSRVWLRDDNIISIEIFNDSKEEIYQVIEDSVEMVRSFSGDAKILAVLFITTTVGVEGAKFRKQIVNRIKDVLENPGFKKAAVYGLNVIMKTVFSFILHAAYRGKADNAKLFSTKEEALKWLKEP